jgi:hypothetical protein
MRVQYPNELLTSVAPKYERDHTRLHDAGHAPMTLGQASYLMTLCKETGLVFDDSLTQVEAERRIAELEDATGRNRAHGSPIS